MAGFALMYFYTFHFPRREYGTNELLSHLIAVLGYLAGINVTNAMARFWFEEQAERDRRAVVSTTLITVGGAGLLLCGGLALLAGPIGALLDPITPDMTLLVRLTLGILLLQLLRETWLRLLQTQERSTFYGVVSVSKVIVEVSCQVWFVAGLGLGLPGIFWGVLIGEALSVAVLTAMLLPRVGLRFDRRIFGLLLAFSLPLIPNGLLQFCLHNIDRYLLAGLVGNDEVGLYAFAYKFGYIPNYLLLTPFLLIWYPYVFSLKDEARQRELVGRFSPYFMFLMTALVLLTSLLARELAHLMSGQDEYLPGWTAIGLVCVGYWFWGLFQLVQTGFYVKKLTRRLPWLTALAVGVNVAGNLWLIPRLGFMGAAWVTLGTFVVLVAITVRAVAPLFAVHWPWGRVAWPAASALAAWGLGMSLPLEPGWTAAGAKLGVFAAWLAAMAFGGFLSRDERRALAGLLRRA